MPNSGGYFSDTLCTSTNNNSNSKTLTNSHPTPTKSLSSNTLVQNSNAMEVDVEDDTKQNSKNEALSCDNLNENVGEAEEADDCEDHFDERLVVDYECHLKQQKFEDELVDDLILPDNEDFVPAVSLEMPDVNNLASTPKSSKSSKQQPTNKLNKDPQSDGIVLKSASKNHFPQNSNISPILSTNFENNEAPQTDGEVLTRESNNYFQQDTNISPILSNEEKVAEELSAKVDDGLALEAEDLDNENDLDDAQSELKRKRESFDSISLMSMESFVLPTSTKKPKLLRTGSITRTIKRSMSFVAVRTPIAKMLRPRRCSVALDSAPNDEDFNNDSLCSFASMETTFNESIRRPVKEKFRSLRNRITRTNSRKEKISLHLQHKSPEKDSVDCQNDGEEFKTPKAPYKHAAMSCSSAPRPATRSTSSSSTASKLCNKSLNLTLNEIPNFPSLSASTISTACSSNLPQDTKSVVDLACVNNVDLKAFSTTITSNSLNAFTTNTTAIPSSNPSNEPNQITNRHHSNVNHKMLCENNCPSDNKIEHVSTGAGHITTVLFFVLLILFFLHKI